MENILPVGTKVRHKKYPQLTGKIVAHEYHETKGISPLPYKVYWDQEIANEFLGWFAIYPSSNSIEPIE